MTTPRRGDVVLVGFVFSDESGVRQRPAVVVSSTAYHRGRREIIVTAVTSNVHRPPLPGDHLLEDWQAAHLRHPSVCTGIVRTIHRNMILRKLGTLSARDLAAVAAELRAALAL